MELFNGKIPKFENEEPKDVSWYVRQSQVKHTTPFPVFQQVFFLVSWQEQRRSLLNDGWAPDIRGLVTARQSFVVELPLSVIWSYKGAFTRKNEDSPYRDCASALVMKTISWLFYVPPCLLTMCYATAGMRRAISHIKATSSRAIATTTTWVAFPRALSLLYRVHNRSCAFQAICRISCGRPSWRLRRCWVTLAW